MGSTRKILIVFGAVLAMLVIAVTALVFLVDAPAAELLPEDTPEGTVQRYLVAVHENRFEDAYAYLKFSSYERVGTFEEWMQFYVGWPEPTKQHTWKATLAEIYTEGSKSAVEVIIDTFRPGSIFENPIYSQNVFFTLERFEGKWFITSPVYIYWTN